MTIDTYRSPRDQARRWACRTAHVLGLIRAGVLRAVDISAPGSRRPTYRISPEDVAEYERQQLVSPPSRPTPRPARRLTPAKYYP